MENENRSQPQEAGKKKGYKKWVIIAVAAIIFYAIGSSSLKKAKEQADKQKNKGAVEQTASEVKKISELKEQKDDRKNHNNEAWICAWIRVEGMLTSPKSADFEFGGATKLTTALGDEKYEIKSHVDAQNAFGAEIRQNFECTVKYKADSNSCETKCSLL
jgi:hypothetical protein